MSAEDFLSSIGLSASPHVSKIFVRSDILDKAEVLTDLANMIKRVDGYITLSFNRKECLKIQSVSRVRSTVEEFVEIVEQWSKDNDIPLKSEDRRFYLCV